MSNYVFGTRLSYQDYLQAMSFERSLKGEISSASKSIIASNEELQRENISVLESGFENLSIQFGEISAGIRELNATFQWVFSEVLTQTCRINDSLQELVRLARSPAQTWAYEQFEIARDADRRELYQEAIEYLNRAINGYGGQTGYKLEYRFHLLLGRIRLGSFRNYSKAIVNPEEAERSFLYAARYAAQDAPKECARALLAAGWAAYSRGDMASAQRHTQEALSFDPQLAEAHFQLAKVLMHVNDPDQALTPLKNAIELDRGYTVKAAADGDFKKYEPRIAGLFNILRDAARKRASEFLTGLEEKKAAAEKQRESQFYLVESLNLEKFDGIIAQANTAYTCNTYYGYLDALWYCNEAQNELARVHEETRRTHQKRAAEAEAKKRANQEESAKRGAYLALVLGILGILVIFLGPVALVLGIRAYRSLLRLRIYERRAAAGWAIGLGGFTSLVLTVALLQAVGRRSNFSTQPATLSPTETGIATGSRVAQGKMPTSFGEVYDASGDADPDTRVPISPDLVYGSAAVKGGNLFLSVRFVPGTFNRQTSCAHFGLDTDQNAATGQPGVNSAGTMDASLLGSEFIVDINGVSVGQGRVLRYVGPPNNTFAFMASFPVTVIRDGIDVAFPLSAIGNDDGKVNFKVTSSATIEPQSFTGILDVMPNAGLPPGSAGYAVPPRKDNKRKKNP